MNIGIDIDDTISETYETLLPYSQKYTIEDLKRKSEIKLKKDYVSHFYIVYMNSWTEQEAMEFWKKYYAEILRKVNIKKFASEVIHQLKQEGHKIYLITARWDMPNADIKGITEQWLTDNKIEYDELITNVSEKVQLIKQKKIDIFIDDSFNNCKKVVESTNAKVYIMDTRVNETCKDDRIERVYSWTQVYDLIKRIKEEAK